MCDRRGYRPVKVRVSGILALLLAASPLAAQLARGELSRAYWGLHRVSAPRIAPDGRNVLYTRWSPDSVADRWVSALWRASLDGRRTDSLLPGRDGAWSPDGSRVAYLTDEPVPRLMVRHLASGNEIALTSDAPAPETFRWSPDGSRIAFTRWVVGAAPPPTTMNGLTRPMATLTWSLWQDGALPPGSRRHLFVVLSAGGDAEDLTPGQMQVGTTTSAVADQAAFDWFPDGRHLVFDANPSPDLEREPFTSEIHFVRVADGTRGRLTAAPGFWHSPLVSPDGKWIAYRGFAAGEPRWTPEALHLMAPNGEQVRMLTPALERDAAHVRWAPDAKSLWFSAEDRGTVNIHQVTIATPTVARAVTNGTHALLLGDVSEREGGVGIAVRSGYTIPDELVRFTFRRPADLQVLESTAQGAEARVWSNGVEELQVPVGDLRIQATLFTTLSLEPETRHPLIVELHDGPHAMYSARFDPGVRQLSAAGWMVLRVNPRGSTGFGTGFARALGRFPGDETADVLAALDAAIALGGIDTTRMALHGCGAGAMTALHLLTATGRFARASLDCLDGRWLVQSGVPPQVGEDPSHLVRRGIVEDPLVWQEHAPIRYASSVRTPLLLVTDACDLASPWGSARALHAALVLRRLETALWTSSGCRAGAGPRSAWDRVAVRMAWYRFNGLSDQ